MLYALLVAGAALCAVQAIRSNQLLSAALWLAGVSALVSIILFNLGAQQVAVVELSVGAGLVTVLFVFAISIAGDDGLSEREFIPNWLAIGIIAAMVLLLGGMIFSTELPDFTASEGDFTTTLWTDRALDVLVQIVLIFTGVLCIVGLLTKDESSEHSQTTAVQQPEVSLLSNTNGKSGNNGHATVPGTVPGLEPAETAITAAAEQEEVQA
ncbi:MAG: hypothetical protein GYB65_10870 [Chloroflexi bacterium]|nr:hypothetical protein [Chloroflexota bacterium]